MKEIFGYDYDTIVFFDTETTGLSADENRIIELAMVQARLSDDSDDGLVYTREADMFIKLPDGETVPEKITELTGITDDMLKEQGIGEREAIKEFMSFVKGDADLNRVLTNKKTLLVAHNAQFDLSFMRSLVKRVGIGVQELYDCDYLDTLTVFKDRSPYPHKLSDAIEHYGLSGEVSNSHRAIDDVMALAEVFKKLDEERNDLDRYINIFGVNPKYGINGEKIYGVEYVEQPYVDRMVIPQKALYNKVERVRTIEDEDGTDRDFDRYIGFVMNGDGYYDELGKFHLYPDPDKYRDIYF